MINRPWPIIAGETEMTCSAGSDAFDTTRYEENTSRTYAMSDNRTHRVALRTSGESVRPATRRPGRPARWFGRPPAAVNRARSILIAHAVAAPPVRRIMGSVCVIVTTRGTAPQGEDRTGHARRRR
jgi:hypothetical protein